MNFQTKFSFLVLVTASFAIIFCSGQENESCMRHEELTPVHNFSTEKISGNWIAWKFFAGLRQDASPPGYRCLEAEILTEDGNPFALTITETVRNITGDGAPQFYTSYANASEITPAIWKTTGDVGTITDSVYVQTDYSNWALQFGCTVEDNYRYEYLFLWTRTREPDAEVLQLLDVVAQNYGFPKEHEVIIDQSSCA